MQTIDARSYMTAIRLWPFNHRIGDLIKVADSDTKTTFVARIVRFNYDRTMTVSICRNRQFICRYQFCFDPPRFFPTTTKKPVRFNCFGDIGGR